MKTSIMKFNLHMICRVQKAKKINILFSVVQSSSTAPREYPVRDGEEQNLDPFCYICKYSQSGVHKEIEIEIRIDVKQHSTTGAKLEGQLLHCDRVKEILVFFI